MDEGIFSNREIATFIWLVVLFFWCLAHPKICASFVGVLKAFFKRQILVAVVLWGAYIAVMVLTLAKLGVWDITLLKETVYWAFGVAFIQLFNVNKAAAPEIEGTRHLWDLIKEQAKWTALLEFISAFYSFHLLVELVLVPALVLLILMNAVAETKDEYKPAKDFTDSLLMVLGLLLIIFVAFKLWQDFSILATLANLRVFLLFPVLTALYLPFLYATALYMAYESITSRWTHFHIKDNPDLLKAAKARLYRHCGVNLNKVNSLWKDRLRLLMIKSQEDLDALFPS